MVACGCGGIVHRAIPGPAALRCIQAWHHTPVGSEAEVVRHHFAWYRSAVRTVTLRAQARFLDRDWAGIQADATERLDLYRRAAERAVAGMRTSLGPLVHARETWAQLKRAYAPLVAGRDDRELAETFFNSVTRKVFTTVGVDPSIEFVDSDFDQPAGPPARPVTETYARGGHSLAALVRTILLELGPRFPYAALDLDARLAAGRIEASLAGAGGGEAVRSAELAGCVFYRGQGAYLVGRLLGSFGSRPMALALLHGPRGVYLDALLLSEDALSLLFSYTRSYFLADAERPAELVGFLGALMPSRKRAELYIALGFNKHGKTELFRDLLRHLRTSEERFVRAPGQPGMVMAVFTLPAGDHVFKVIRDRFAEPKTTTRAHVRARYDLVFRHDRAGRLIDAQEFEHLAFPRARFEPGLLDELLNGCAATVSARGDEVVLQHLYAERRLTPLDLYLRQADPAHAREAVVDFGQAVRDLAACNVFPGDILLKNFGVTRQRRVVFYDYDELALLTECVFRDLPEARSDEEETGAEPWFYVGPRDVFPEEFVRFLGLTPELRGALLEAHGEVFRARFWQDLQARHRAGEVVDIFPYSAQQRLVRPRR